MDSGVAPDAGAPVANDSQGSAVSGSDNGVGPDNSTVASDSSSSAGFFGGLLASTGFTAGTLATGGAVVLLAGVGAVLVARRRRAE